MAVDFVRAHHGWAAPVTFALESIALFSLLIPGWAALVGIGVLVAASDIPFWPVWIAGAVGAALGDGVSYWLGYKFKEPIGRVWPLARYPDLLPRGLSWSGGACSASSSAGWPAARGGSVGRGNPRNALLDFSNRQFHLGFCLGLVVIGHRRPWGGPSAMVSLIWTKVIAYTRQRSLPSERAYRTWQAPARRDSICCRQERVRWRSRVHREKDARSSRT
jgi:hypothetical protein